MATVSETPQSAPPEALVSDLCWLLYRSNQRLQAEFAEALHASGLTPRKHQVLIAARGGDQTQTALARTVGLDKTTMMVTLDELERDGLAERRPLPSDRRARVIAVTPAGASVLDAADAELAAARERVLATLPESERGPFLQALGRLACPMNGLDAPAGDCADAPA